MANLINPSDLTFSGKEVREFAQVIREEMVWYPPMQDQFFIVEDIIAKEQIVLMGHMSKITRKDLGCGKGQLSKNVPFSEKFWDPVNMKIWLNECWEQFQKTFMVYFLNVGGDKADLTNTQIFSQWLVEEVATAAARDCTRIAWFADKQAKSVTAGGVFTDGIELLDYSMLDGLFKQLFEIATANPKQHTKISQNDETTTDKQMTFTDAQTKDGYITKVLSAMYYKADRRLRAHKDKMFWVTRSIGDQYIQERLAVANIELPYTRLESGVDSLPIHGTVMLVMDQWDDVIASDQDSGTKLNLPHRAVLGLRHNTQVGFDKSTAVDDFDIFYDKMSETSNIKGAYRMDTKVIEDYLVQFGY